jgi:outer membrane protein TolC
MKCALPRLAAGSLLCLLPHCFALRPGHAQSPAAPPHQFTVGAHPGLFGIYSPQYIPPVSVANSTRLQDLIRDGNLYLSLQDAIALALENNLDVEVQRYTPQIASTDVLRARGGGALRGLPTTIAELPEGFNVLASPIVTTAAGGVAPSTSIPTDLSALSQITPGQSDVSIGASTFSLGPPIPAFDPALNGGIIWQHQKLPESNVFITGQPVLTSRSLNANLGVNQGFSTGTQLGLDFSSDYLSQNSLRTVYNPSSATGLGLTLTQPLLRGFGPGVNRRFIRVAKNNQRISDQVFRLQAIATVSGIIRLYWDLVSLNEDLKVRQQTLVLAKQLYSDNKSKVQQGTLAPIELVRAQAQVAAAQQDLANSEGSVREQELLLKNVLTRRATADPGVAAVRIVPTDVITIPATGETPSLPDLMRQALADRPELVSADLELENAHTYLKGSRNELLPEIDLVGNAQNAGLAGRLNSAALAGTVLPPGSLNIGGLGTALTQNFHNDYPTYAVGIQLYLPLRNRIAQADYARDQIQLRQTELRRQQLENRIRMEVEDAQIALQTARTAYEAAVQARQLQEQSLKIEQERYSVGLSTNFLVIQYQSFLAQARSTEVVARSSYMKARTALERAIGATLSNNNVSLAEAYSGHISRLPSPIP